MATWNPKGHLKEITYLASLGLTEKQIATKLNIHQDVLRYHRNNNPELENALQIGLNSTIIIAVEQLTNLIKGGDFKAIKFFLEKKAGWGDSIVSDSNVKPTHSTFQLNLVKKETDDSVD